MREWNRESPLCTRIKEISEEHDGRERGLLSPHEKNSLQERSSSPRGGEKEREEYQCVREGKIPCKRGEEKQRVHA